MQKYFTVIYLKLLTLKNDSEPEIVICLLSLSKTKNVCVEIDSIQQKKKHLVPVIIHSWMKHCLWLLNFRGLYIVISFIFKKGPEKKIYIISGEIYTSTHSSTSQKFIHVSHSSNI